jgi:hypothetical protein
MVCFDIPASVPHTIVVAARGPSQNSFATGDIVYYLLGYIANLQYYFKFAPLQPCNITLAIPLDGSMACYIEAIPLEGALPPDNINEWVAFWHEDALSREGRSTVIRPMQAILIGRENGPSGAQ